MLKITSVFFRSDQFSCEVTEKPSKVSGYMIAASNVDVRGVGGNGGRRFDYVPTSEKSREFIAIVPAGDMTIVHSCQSVAERSSKKSSITDCSSRSVRSGSLGVYTC